MKIKLLFAVIAVVMAVSACSQGNKRQTAECPHQKSACCETELPVFDNAGFYADGRFNEEAAKDAVIRLMKFYHYPVAEKTREQLWVSDYGTGRFAELGLAAIMYVNDTQDRYMLQDLFLLPHQMLPEHWHEKPDGDLPAKMEGWLVRNGVSYIIGEGEDNLASFPEIKIPACHDGGVTVGHVVKAVSGDFVPLSKVFSHHWQFAGDKGAIITEVANVHDNASVRHQVKAINDHFLGK
jgi:D-lyxose ketol-isomerase